MNIPQGYKQTELGIIPEDWEVKQIRDGLNLLTDFDANGSFADMAENVQTYNGGGYAWYVRATDLEQNTPLSDVKYVDEASYKFLKKSSLHGGEVLIAKRGDIGKVYLFQAKTTFATLAPNLYLLKLNEQVHSTYLYYYLKSINGQKALKDINASTSLGALYKEDVKNLYILYPPIAEQRAIAEALSDVDGLIAALDKKIDKKRLLKQGAMQQLLTGKKRLPGFTDKWIEKKLGKISHIKTGGRNGDQAVENGKYPFFVRSQKVYAIDTYSFDGEAILVPGEGGIGNIFHYINGKFDFHQRVYKISDFADEACGKFIYFYMSRYFGEYALSLTVKATVDSLRLPTFEEFVICMPSDIKEQRAIATILSDMDKEIADLEAQRDKYRLLKSGMMQKLLTGQIRLVKQQAKIVPLGAEVPVVREIPVATHIIAGHIVNRSHKSRGWGRTKLQKSLHLIGYCMQLNLGNEYIRNTAGPDDQQLMDYIDQKFKQYRHVAKVSEKLPDGRTRYSYIPTAMIQDIEIAYEQYPKELRDQIDALIDKLNTMDLAGAEILSTLYAVWNNSIIKQEQITDDLLIADFYAWSKHKADFEETRVKRALDYMRKENIIPIGWGKYIDKR